MIGYVTVGADDITRAERFYTAILAPLGYGLTYYQGDLSYTLPSRADARQAPPDFYVKSPFDGTAASAGNGTMIAFEADSQKQVRTLHAAGLAAGGTSEGAPGFREAYSAHFYVSYLRDPQGNKIALYSNNSNEPGRDA